MVCFMVDGRRRAAVAASLQPQPHDAVVARRAARRCRRANGGTGRTWSRAWRTRVSRSRGCSPWSRSRPPTTSSRAGVEDRRAGLAGRLQVLEDALQPGAVQVEDGLHDLPRLGLRRGVGEALHLLQQGVEPLQPRLELARVEVSRTSSTSVAAAGVDSSVPAPLPLHAEHGDVLDVEQLARCPGTCGRRRAGTGRSCAPRA